MPTGKLIKEIRIKKGLTQKQLGDKCGIADANIRKYENGKQSPKIETLHKIAAALEVDIYELMEIPFGPFDNSDTYTPHPNKEKIMEDIYTADLLSAFNELNESGKQRAVSQVQLVASVPEFRKVSLKEINELWDTDISKHIKKDEE